MTKKVVRHVLEAFDTVWRFRISVMKQGILSVHHAPHVPLDAPP